MSPGTSRFAGELRLRVVPSDDPASFESGSDLLKSNGQLWSRSLYVLSKNYIPLYNILRKEGFVPDDLDLALSTLPPGLPRCQLLHTFNDTFIIDFSNSSMHFSVITEQGMAALNFRGLFSEIRKISRGTPYTGAYTNHHLSTLP